MPDPFSLEALSAVITAAFPDMAGSRFALLTEGWDSVAVDVDDAVIFKFPRSAEATRRLVYEADILSIARPAVRLPLPDLTLHEAGGRMFSRHAKIAGDHLLAAQYDRLDESARARLAGDMAEVFAALHGIARETALAAGAASRQRWPGPDEIARDLEGKLPQTRRDFAQRTLAAFAALPPDPQGEVFGYFDGHGWNMAFDHATGRLNGLFDFADSGLDDLHREFVYPGFIARDLTWRIAARYGALTGRDLDMNRIDVETAYLRLVEVAGCPLDDPRLPSIVGHLERWANGL